MDIFEQAPWLWFVAHVVFFGGMFVCTTVGILKGRKVSAFRNRRQRRRERSIRGAFRRELRMQALRSRDEDRLEILRVLDDDDLFETVFNSYLGENVALEDDGERPIRDAIARIIDKIRENPQEFLEWLKQLIGIFAGLEADSKWASMSGTSMDE